MDGNRGVEQGAQMLLAVRQPTAARPAGGRGRADPYAALEREGDASEETEDSEDDRHPSGGDSSPSGITRTIGGGARSQRWKTPRTWRRS